MLRLAGFGCLCLDGVNQCKYPLLVGMSPAVSPTYLGAACHPTPIKTNTQTHNDTDTDKADAARQPPFSSGVRLSQWGNCSETGRHVDAQPTTLIKLLLVGTACGRSCWAVPAANRTNPSVYFSFGLGIDIPPKRPVNKSGGGGGTGITIRTRFDKDRAGTVGT